MVIGYEQLIYNDMPKKNKKSVDLYLVLALSYVFVVPSSLLISEFTNLGNSNARKKSWWFLAH